jgi:tRNA (cytidine32/uridine32-2'-O)-methyltransferase
MTTQRLRSIRTVLVRPTHAGNIGATARALKNMGLEQLYLVAQEDYPSPEAEARAADAKDVLARAVVSAGLDEALRECHFVMGTSARARRITWPLMNPRTGAARLLLEAERGPVALLFGQERTGLTNEELDRCHALVHIPASPSYSSLNLACAVQILAYEMYQAAAVVGGQQTASESDMPASAEEVERFYRHLEAVLVEIAFLDPANPRFLMRRLRRLFGRAQPDQNDINILRGILTEVQKTVRYKLDKNAKE